MITAFTAPGIVCIPLSGALIDRYGRKPIMVASLLFYGAAGTGIGLTTTLPWLSCFGSHRELRSPVSRR
jgi:MFS family permease